VSVAAFIVSQRAEHGVPFAVSCRALGVSQAWFYKWRHGDVSLRRARRAALDAAVAWLFRRRGGRDGSPPITAALQDLGWRVSKNTVAASMRRQGLVARPKKKRRGLTRADRRARKAPDLIRRDFTPPPRVNQRWVSDLTEIPTDQGTLYLASILDLSSRRAVGYALGPHHDADLAAAAVCVAIAVRGGDVAGVVLHTDQGGEYTGGQLTKVCARAGIVQSMGRTGSALDNAVSESFHSTLEFELLSRNRFATHDQARRAVAAWLEEYNTVRLHSTNGLISPVDYEHGRRRPGAKSYDRLRRRRHHANAQKNAKNEAEAAAPPDTLSEPLRDGHRRRAASGPAPPASRAATAVAAATGRDPVAAAPGPRPALDPGASTGPGQATPTAGRGLPSRTRDATRPRFLSTENYKITSTGVSTV
jgi:transposase InsO family protein